MAANLRQLAGLTSPSLAGVSLRRTLVAERQAEAADKQRAVIQWLNTRGGNGHGLWLTNAVTASLSASAVRELGAHPAVWAVHLDAPLTTTGATTWDGENVKSTTGHNAGRYTNNGYTAEREDVGSGSNLSVAVLDFFFNATHPVFRDSGGGATRVRSTSTCNNGNPCVAGLPAVPMGATVHGSWCASAAAADAMDSQISGTTAARRDRTGLAEEGEMMFISTGAIADTIRGLERAVALEADVVSESFGGADNACDGVFFGWENAVYNAVQAGVLVVGSAGNRDPRMGNCTLTGLSEAPSQFVVGGTNDPGAGAYATVTNTIGGTPGWSEGGVDVTIDGLSFSEVFTQVSVSSPVVWQFAANTGSSFTAVAGTSLAAPQVAGAALLFKDWMIAQGFGAYANSPGVMFVNMLAMSDRANGNTTYSSSGFSPVWGGGRFQMRYYDPADHPSGLWRWETATYGQLQPWPHRPGRHGSPHGEVRS